MFTGCAALAVNEPVAVPEYEERVTPTIAVTELAFVLCVCWLPLLVLAVLLPVLLDVVAV